MDWVRDERHDKGRHKGRTIRGAIRGLVKSPTLIWVHSFTCRRQKKTTPKPFAQRALLQMLHIMLDTSENGRPVRETYVSGHISHDTATLFIAAMPKYRAISSQKAQHSPQPCAMPLLGTVFLTDVSARHSILQDIA